MIEKWKMDGDYQNMLRSGRPKKLTDKDRRVLAKEIRKNRTKPMVDNLIPFVKNVLHHHPILL